MEYNNQKYLYIGETDLNQLPTGLGVLYTNGKKYEGYFCKGKILGLGRFIDKEGNSYEGIFRGNKIISKATVIKRNDNDKKVVFFGDIVDLRIKKLRKKKKWKEKMKKKKAIRIKNQKKI